MKRKLDLQIIEALEAAPLWKERLREDCLKGVVFPAVRDNRIDFYYKGGKLFGYDAAGFKTHIKYAAVIDAGSENTNYLTETQLTRHKLISDFCAGYERIKENCANYSGIEAEKVASICSSHSYISPADVVVLDMEISFDSLEVERKQDRIDLLVFDKNSRRLQFVEAKHFSNSEIWSNQTPKVVGQIGRYEQQIAHNHGDIIDQYVRYVNIVNKIFGLSLPAPELLSGKVSLLIFGFDRDQREGRLKTLVKNSPAFQTINSYHVGEVKNIGLKNLFVKECL